MTIFAARGQGFKLVNDGNLIARNWKIENFEQNLCYVAQKKLRTCRIQIQVEKVWIFEKKTSFWIFLNYFPKGGPFGVKMVNFYFSIFQNFIFLFQKQVYWDQTDTEINKVMNFGDSSHKTVEMPDCFRLCGPKRAPLSRNRVKNQHSGTFKVLWSPK